MSPARPFVVATLLGLAAAWSAPAGAQQIFRIIGADGRVTFTDRAPVDPGAKVAPAAVVGMGSAEAGAGLPFELRNVASRFPVTLYTGANCIPCASARNFLATRGVPFTEKTISTNPDIDALTRLSGSQSLPFATIGAQQLKGFSEVEWGQFLDAAGYPQTSQLPASYRNPPPSPLVAVDTPAPRAPASAARAAAPVVPTAPPTPAANPNNPAGIQF